MSLAAVFAAQIKQQLGTQGLSQLELAQRLGISEGRVSQLLNGRGNLTLRTMARIAQVLGLELQVVVRPLGVDKLGGAR